MTTDTFLVRVTEALRVADWSGALSILDEGTPELEPSQLAEALEAEAQAAYGAGEFERAIEAWERLHAHELELGHVVAAARAAAMTAMHLLIDTGLMAPVRGWLVTAERVLEGAEEGPAHAVVAMTRTYERFICGDLDAAREWSHRAIELGRAHDVNPAVVIGMTAAARVRIFDGDVDGGLAGLDEVGALLMRGGADPLTTGMMYCEIVCAAQGLALHGLAAEWTEVMERWRHGEAFGGLHGRCRVHRAEILRVSGPSDTAEAEALGACDELRPWMRREYGWPLVELGNIRLRRGDLDGAEEAYLEAHTHAWSPQPGLALLHLERGEVSVAAAMIDDAIARPMNLPSKEHPPIGDLRLAPMLAAQCEIAAAGGDVGSASIAADRLTDIAGRFHSPFLSACADLAAARVALLSSDSEQAIGRAEQATRTWADIGAPFEVAAARVVLAEAFDAAGRPDAAKLERTAAVAGFRSYGAVRRADDTERLIDQVDGPSVDVGPARAVGFHAADGQRTIEFGGRTSVVADLKGMRLIERLAASPGREFHVLDLVAADVGVLRPGGVRSDDAEARGGEAGLPVLDDAARESYRRRLAEIDAEIDDARSMNDLGRAELGERDREYLIRELSQAVGLSGRNRTVGGSAERARTSITRSIRYAIERIATTHPELSSRLHARIHTGTYCWYEPDLVAPLRWEF